MRLVFLSHPVAGDIEGNIERALAWLRWAMQFRGVSPIAPWIPWVRLADDRDPKQRALGLRRCMEALRRCDELWLCGSHVSEGMRDERRYAELNYVRVSDFTGSEWPEEG